MEPILLTTPDIVIRLLIAVGLGVLMGIERTIAGKTAGMRTYALVALGAALFVVVGFQMAAVYGIAQFDVSRIVSQVVVGIGFIGAGLIIFREDKVQGLTTAAGLWVVAAVGIAAGCGLYLIACIAAVIALIIFTVVWYLEKPIKRLGEIGGHQG